MSAVTIAWRAHPDFPLVLLYNRDESRQRASMPAAWWAEPASCLAGRDLKGGGTWLAVSRVGGRFALVTDWLGAHVEGTGTTSRGELPLKYLASDDDPVAFVRPFMRDKGPYAPFNLIVGNPRQAHYVATRSRLPVPLTEGVHTLANGLLDQHEPVSERLGTLFGATIKAAGGFATLMDGYPRLIDAQALYDCHFPVPDRDVGAADIAAAAWVILADRQACQSSAIAKSNPDAPDSRRSAIFNSDPEHGTRSSTVFIMGRDGSLHFEERSFDAGGTLLSCVRENWQQDPAGFGAPD